ncbi:MAG: F0F1 ATP synthase subunit A [Alphaproteobacteria bacterium]
MANPIEQFIVVSLTDNKPEIYGMDLSFTNASLWMVITACVSILFLTIAMHRKAMVPGRLQMTAELIYEFISKMVTDNIGKKGRHYFPFIFTIFMFVFVGNIMGLLPYSFTYTSHLIVAGVMALCIMFMTVIFGVYNHGLKFFSLFLPPNVPWWLVAFVVPIEIISFFVRPITHSVRLCANMMAGHLILKVILGFSVAAVGMGSYWSILAILPMLVDVAFLVFELLVACIQAYVFAILSCVYLKDTVDLHH